MLHRTNKPRRPTSWVRVAVALAAGTALTCAGCSTAVDTQDVVDDPSPSTSALGSDEFYKITMNVTNSTNLTWDVTAQTLGHEGSDGGAWDERPVSLAPNATETVSAYSAVQGQAITLTYQSEGTSYKVVLVAQDPAIGPNNYDGTKGDGPVGVKAAITSGRGATATYTIFATGQQDVAR